MKRKKEIIAASVSLPEAVLAVILSMVLLVAVALANTADAQPVASSSTKLNVSLLAKCSDQGAEIRIVNRGRSWPSAGVLRIIDLRTGKPVSIRRLQLNEGQKSTFSITLPRYKRDVGVFVSPDWYYRGIKVDARLDCTNR